MMAKAAGQLASNRPTPFHTHGRLAIERPLQPLVLAKPNSIKLNIRSDSRVSQILSKQTEYFGETGSFSDGVAGSDAVLTLQTREGGDYVDIVPLALGRVEVNIIIFFVDGGISSEKMLLDVVPPIEKPVSLIVGNSGVDKNSDILLEYSGTSEHVTGSYVFLRAKYDGVKQQVNIPARFATFAVRSTPGPATISIDRNGQIFAYHLGHSLLETSYGGIHHLSCVVVLDPHSYYIGRRQCQDLLKEGETIEQ